MRGETRIHSRTESVRLQLSSLQRPSLFILDIIVYRNKSIFELLLRSEKGSETQHELATALDSTNVELLPSSEF